MRVLSALLALAALSVTTMPRTAHAFCRSTTTERFTPTEEQPCDTAGKPLFWPSRCITMLVNRSASAKASLETTQSLLAGAFAKWSNVTCDACGAPGKPSLVGTEGGPTDCGFGFDRTPGAVHTNVLSYYDKVWPNDADQIALTTVSYRIDTGEILDADLQINSTMQLATDGRSDAFDLDSVITHEVGHVLGLAHSGDPNATMRITYEPGDTTIRNLTGDDVCGICAAAPPGREAPCNAVAGTCTPTTPDAGGTDAGTTPVTDGAPGVMPETSVGDPGEAPGYTCGCSTPGRASPFGWPALGVALLAIRLRSRSGQTSRSRRSSCTPCRRSRS